MKINLELNSKDLKKLAKKLDNIANKSFIKMVDEFIETILKELFIESIKLLDTRTNGYDSSDIRQNYSINVKNGNGILLYYDKAVAFAEFGTGQIGEETTDEEIKQLARSLGYDYNVGDKIKRNTFGYDYWVFKLEGRWIKFSGYAGKGFIHDAFINYFSNTKNIENIFEEMYHKYIYGQLMR